MGTAHVELRDAENRPISGFTLADWEEAGGNLVGRAVCCKRGTDVGSLAGRPIQVHVKLERAKLYAFQFSAE
jgi:hypothetical protein